jgi:hypothetical protein
LKNIYQSYPHLKFFGFGAGAVLLAPLAGLQVDFHEKNDLTFIGRR